MIRLLHGDCRVVLPTLPSASVQCCVTSPPYFGLRDYGVDGQIGLEPTPDTYVAELVAVFREVRRVLRDDGTVFLNLGDSYVSNGRYDAAYEAKNNRSGIHSDDAVKYANYDPRPAAKAAGLKVKDLIGIPWMVAFALRADGWWLRSDIIWAKKNCMPESVTDRPSSAHEHVFLLAKSARYFFDAEAIREEGVIPAGTRAAKGSNVRSDLKDVNGRPPEYWNYTGTRNSRNVWSIATQPYADAHFATFPPELAERCIRAGSSEGGCCATCRAPLERQTEKTIAFASGSGRSGRKPSGKGAGGTQTESGSYDVRMGPVVQSATMGWAPSCQCDAAVESCTVLDPFSGAGTTSLVADRLGRHAIGIELNPAYSSMAANRVVNDGPLFAEVATS